MGCFSKPESKSQSQTVSTGTSYIPEQRAALTKGLQVYTPALGKGMNVYQGERVAPTTESQKGVFDFAQGGGFITTPQQVNEYFQTGIKEPAMRTLRQDVLPAVKEAFSGPGYWSSARATEEARATEDTVAELGRQKAEIQWDTLQANKQGAFQQLAVGQAEQEQNQRTVNAAIQKFAEENQITDPTNMNILMNLLGVGMQTRTSVGTSTGEGQGAGLGYASIGGIAGGLGAGVGYGLTEKK